MSRHGKFFSKAEVDEHDLAAKLCTQAAEMVGYWSDFIRAQEDQRRLVGAEEAADKIFKVLRRGYTRFTGRSVNFWLLPFSSGLTGQEVTTLLHTVLFGGLLRCFHATKSLLRTLFVRQWPGEFGQVDTALWLRSRRLVHSCLHVTLKLLKKIPQNGELWREMFTAQVDRVPSISFLLLLFLSHLDLLHFKSLYKDFSPYLRWMGLNLPSLFSTKPITARLLREAGFPVAADDAVVVPHHSFLEFWVVARSLTVARQEASLPDWCATDGWGLAMATAVTPPVAEHFVRRLLEDEEFALLYHLAAGKHKYALFVLLHSKISSKLQKQLMMHCVVHYREMLGSRVNVKCCVLT